MIFEDRRDAGRRLADQLGAMAALEPVVIALPRGGVPVAVEVACALRAPLDVLAVRKLGASINPEFAIGAVAEEEVGVVDHESVRLVGMTDDELRETIAGESRELARRVAAYRDGRTPVDVTGRTVLIVDDGLATGLTALAAVRAMRRRGAARVVMAAPVGSRDAVALLEEEADDVVVAHVPHRFGGVGRWYVDFAPVSDDEVVALLATAAGVARPEPQAVTVQAGGATLHGDLAVPPGARGLVIFAHGSGSSRRSPRNRAVAGALQDGGFATLLFDLLAEAEEGRRDLVFDIPLLADRLRGVTAWAQEDAQTAGLPIGYFGASTGAAAALIAAADDDGAVRAVVSRGGRPDLAGGRLADVTAPTLLVVGGADHEVLALNRRAAERLTCGHDVAVVDGATHLFEEPGALDAVAELARDWFTQHLTPDPLAGAGAGVAGRPHPLAL